MVSGFIDRARESSCSSASAFCFWAFALTDQVAASAGVAERLETMRRLLREHGRLAADAARAHVIIPYDEDEAVRL